jgi:type IV pilus assembly protein PilX
MTRERGAVLLLVLVILAGVSMASLSAARSGVVAGQASRYGAGQAVAHAAARAALADAERDIAAGVRSAVFRDPAHWPRAGCGEGVLLGICATETLPAWRRVDLADSDATAPYGAFTGRGMPTGAHALPARLPRYIVEVAAAGQAGDDAGAPPEAEFRITAVGYGPDPRTIAVVQSTYRLAAP